jgi:hypothetical protein
MTGTPRGSSSRRTIRIASSVPVSVSFRRRSAEEGRRPANRNRFAIPARRPFTKSRSRPIRRARQDVLEHDRGVEVERVDRQERHLRRELGRTDTSSIECCSGSRDTRAVAPACARANGCSARPAVSAGPQEHRTSARSPDLGLRRRLRTALPRHSPHEERPESLEMERRLLRLRIRCTMIESGCSSGPRRPTRSRCHRDRGRGTRAGCRSRARTAEGHADAPVLHEDRVLLARKLLERAGRRSGYQIAHGSAGSRTRRGALDERLLEISSYRSRRCGRASSAGFGASRRTARTGETSGTRDEASADSLSVRSATPVGSLTSSYSVPTPRLERSSAAARVRPRPPYALQLHVQPAIERRRLAVGRRPCSATSTPVSSVSSGRSSTRALAIYLWSHAAASFAWYVTTRSAPARRIP